MRRRLTAHRSEVVDLSGVRARLRLTSYQDQVARSLEGNERALRALYASELLFTRAGTRVGRDLLLARQYLLKVASLLRRLSDEGEVPAPRLTPQIEAVYTEVNGLLEQGADLIERAAPFLKHPPHRLR